MSEYPILDTFEYIAKCTPDFIELNNSEYFEFPLFVYGNTMNGHKNHNKFLDEAVYYGRAVTTVPTYNLRTIADDAVAFHFMNGKGSDGRKISTVHLSGVIGELYGVSLRTLAEMDFLMNNGRVYNRVQRWFSGLDQAGGNKSIQGYMYIGDMDFWGDEDYILSNMRRCFDADINGYNGFYWGEDPRTMREITEADEDSMYENYPYGRWSPHTY